MADALKEITEDGSRTWKAHSGWSAVQATEARAEALLGAALFKIVFWSVFLALWAFGLSAGAVYILFNH